MLIDETKYIWSKGQPEDIELSVSPFSYVPEEALRIYRFEGDGEITILESEDSETSIYQGQLPYEPAVPIACDGLVFVTDIATDEENSEAVGADEVSEDASNTESAETTEETGSTATEENPITIHLIAEIGYLKTVLTPYLNTSEGMDFIHDGYNDDGTYSTEGLANFKFNGTTASTIYVSSNHWIGFGANSEQLRILRRDGCSTALYRQTGETTNGLQFIKIRFEGYTVYSQRIEENRLIYELFLLSNNDMFLNIIQTPTNSNIGYSELVCNGKTTSLTLADGTGAGCQVSFYHQDSDGKEWDICYAMYEETDKFSYAYLMKQASTYYTITDGVLTPCEIENLTAAMFMKYGFEELSTAALLTPLVNPEIYLWKTGGSEELLKVTAKAYPYPQTLSAVADMSHISIIGIKLLTAEYSGNVGICVSLDDGASYAEEVSLGDWLNTDVEELWNSLPEDRKLYIRFILHDNAALSRFKITYNN